MQEADTEVPFIKRYDIEVAIPIEILDYDRARRHSHRKQGHWLQGSVTVAEQHRDVAGGLRQSGICRDHIKLSVLVQIAQRHGYGPAARRKPLRRLKSGRQL